MQVLKVKLVLVYFYVANALPAKLSFQNLTYFFLKRGVGWRCASVFGGSEVGEYQVSCLYHILCLSPLGHGLPLNRARLVTGG